MFLQHTKVTVVDTPGFGDSDDRSEKDAALRIEEMLSFLSSEIQTAGAIVVQIKTKGFPGIDKSIKDIFRTMTRVFGRDVWSKMIINFG